MRCRLQSTASLRATLLISARINHNVPTTRVGIMRQNGHLRCAACLLMKMLCSGKNNATLSATASRKPNDGNKDIIPTFSLSHSV